MAYRLKQHPEVLTDAAARCDLAAGFQAAVVDSLTSRAWLALEQEGCSRLVVCGGVAANGRLRQVLQEHAQGAGTRPLFASPGALHRQRRHGGRPGLPAAASGSAFPFPEMFFRANDIGNLLPLLQMLIPLTPLCQRGETIRNCFKSPPLEKGIRGNSTWNEFMANVYILWCVGRSLMCSDPKKMVKLIVENHRGIVIR